MSLSSHAILLKTLQHSMIHVSVSVMHLYTVLPVLRCAFNLFSNQFPLWTYMLINN